MKLLAAFVGCLLLLVILWDAFEAIVLPRRVSRRLRLTRLFYRFTWKGWSLAARRMKPGKKRNSYLGYYGPLSLLFLLGVWALGLIIGFAMLHWAEGSRLDTNQGTASFKTDLYMSGTTFFTLGLGDVVPRGPMARFLTVAEAGMGFGFLAMAISYFPMLYQAFSKREIDISLLDARAGSPPSAVELLRRYGHKQNLDALAQLLRDWEVWSAELLEGLLSYPVLGYFRSQHNNQSWLAALTTILDACSLIIVSCEGAPDWQARMTFAMARHAIVDLAQVYDAPPRPPNPERLSSSELRELHILLEQTAIPFCDVEGADKKLAHLRRNYESYVNSLADHFMVTLPSWRRAGEALDNWQTSAWEHTPARFEESESAEQNAEHSW